ncbi:MAG: response regulator [Cyclobacteriaceae bacterium]|nr:response regulator [Cyclobacteriaceae bacterium]
MELKRILIIEDDVPLCWLLERILKGKFEVEILQNGLDALAWLSGNKLPDLIISDLHMPSLDGIELLENIQTSGILRSIPVIILSGSEDPEMRKRCLALGAGSYIIKPFEPQLLIEEIENTFKRVEKPLAINR